MFTDDHVDELDRAMKNKRIENKTPSVTRAPFTIAVTNLPENPSEEELELYFESKKYSDGGDVDNVKLFDDALGAIVTFEKEEGEFMLTAIAFYSELH